MGEYIQTRSGKSFYYDSDDIECINIEDIAGALSKLCRFRGQCVDFYSVAQHSIVVSNLVSAKYRLAALLHDAAEAYIGDFPSPLKREFPQLNEFEDRILKRIARKFRLDVNDLKCDEIKRADLIVLLLREIRSCQQLMKNGIMKAKKY